MTAALHPGSTGPAGMAMSSMIAPLSQACAVRLIDRRTGRPHRINGSPLVLFTKCPTVAVAELLSGRDPSVWEARVEQIGADNATVGGRK